MLDVRVYWMISFEDFPFFMGRMSWLCCLCEFPNASMHCVNSGVCGQPDMLSRNSTDEAVYDWVEFIKSCNFLVKSSETATTLKTSPTVVLYSILLPGKCRTYSIPNPTVDTDIIFMSNMILWTVFHVLMLELRIIDKANQIALTYILLFLSSLDSGLYHILKRVLN